MATKERPKTSTRKLAQRQAQSRSSGARRRKRCIGCCTRCCWAAVSRRRRPRRTRSARSAASAICTSARKRWRSARSRALRPDDYVITAYREHVQALAKGMTSREVMAELYGRRDGCIQGQGRVDAPVQRRAQLPGRLGHRRRADSAWRPVSASRSSTASEDRVCLCFMGEAAVNQGAFHESLNMAALWKLPVIFIVENNRFGMGTAWERASSLYDISQKAARVRHAVRRCGRHGRAATCARPCMEAVERAREGRHAQPSIEARCYRFMGHSMSDPVHGVYRTKEEVEEARSRSDPIRMLIDQLQGGGLLSEDELKRSTSACRKNVEDAARVRRPIARTRHRRAVHQRLRRRERAGRLFFDRKNRLES